MLTVKVLNTVEHTQIAMDNISSVEIDFFSIKLYPPMSIHPELNHPFEYVLDINTHITIREMEVKPE